MTVKTLKTF